MASVSMTKVNIGGADYEVPALIWDEKQFYVSIYVLKEGDDRHVRFLKSKKIMPADRDRIELAMSKAVIGEMQRLAGDSLFEEPRRDLDGDRCFVIVHPYAIGKSTMHSASRDVDDLSLESLAKAIDHGEYGLICSPPTFVSAAVQGNEESSARFRQGENWKNVNPNYHDDSKVNLTSDDVATTERNQNE